MYSYALTVHDEKPGGDCARSCQGFSQTGETAKHYIFVGLRFFSQTAKHQLFVVLRYFSQTAKHYVFVVLRYFSQTAKHFVFVL
jgi:hypothetical protein